MEEEEDRLLLNSLGVTSANPEDIERDILKEVSLSLSKRPILGFHLAILSDCELILVMPLSLFFHCWVILYVNSLCLGCGYLILEIFFCTVCFQFLLLTIQF